MFLSQHHNDKVTHINVATGCLKKKQLYWYFLTSLVVWQLTPQLSEHPTITYIWIRFLKMFCDGLAV